MPTRCLLCEKKQITFCRSNQDLAVQLKCQTCGYHFLVYYDQDEALPNFEDITPEICTRCKDQTPCKVLGAGENARCPHNTILKGLARGATSLADVFRRNLKRILFSLGLK